MLAQDPWKPHPLTQSEIQHIRQRCAKFFGDSLRLHAHVRLLKARPVNTAEERQRLVLEVRRCEGEAMKAYIAYQLIFWRTFRIHDLPMEILSNIIRFVVWSAPSPQIGIRWRLQLTWVSRYLRHAAISDPTLWNAIWFRDNPPFERSLAFVGRSGISPLDLRINDTPTRKFTDQEVCALLKALTPHLHHIRMLIILFEDWEPILSVLKWLSDYGKEGLRPLTMERFEIHRTGNPYLWPGLVWRGTKFDPVNHSVSLYSLFGGRYVPELKSFTMNGVYIDWVNTPSLENLTTLDLRRIPLELCPSLPRFRQILSSSPMLTKLSLDGAGPASNPTTVNNYPAIDLPHLHTLVLANFAAPFTKTIVSHFTAPNAKDLTIMNFKGFNYGPFYEFMIGRFPKIRLLTLYTTSCPSDILPVMIKWLDSMPLLAYARLAAVEHDILQAFLFDPDTMKVHPCLPPSLRTSFGIVEDLTFTGLTAPSQEALDDVERKPRIVSPRLDVLEVQTIEPTVFADFVLARKLCGVPVKKTYMAPSMADDYTPAALANISKHIKTLMRVEIGAKTQEEEELLNAP
ncbi:hypothetical protein F5878DRAFT_4352 [Lentinula raphanica]|uniref:F-box domain-containing protein n=1 Tax=Lentinula raphanica TaxID=153919 RepID=A0AA38PLJ3_9AGAR|nr:hypothetical protein F5878DRAFT_4352 [Lentinula raphanica]